MHIGIDASRAAIKHRTGTENYSYHLIRSLLELSNPDPEGQAEHRYTLYFNTAPEAGLLPSVPYCQTKMMPFPRLWTHGRLSWEMLWHRPDTLFVPAHVLPIIHPRRSVATIHDLGYLYYPETYGRTERRYLAWSTAHNARTASHIIADSIATKEDIVKHLGVDPSKITVVYPAASEEFRPDIDDREVAALKSYLGIEGDYFLYVGTLRPRKNVPRLLEAYARLRRRRQIDARLVLAGRKDWLPQHMLERLDGIMDSVTITGFFPPEQLPFLIKGAMALIIPSLFEGFGMTALEAMACGTPVIAADTSSLPEVVGDAGILVNPLSVESIAEGMAQVAYSPRLREELRARGLSRARDFSWEKAARQVMAVLEQVGT